LEGGVRIEVKEKGWRMWGMKCANLYILAKYLKSSCDAEFVHKSFAMIIYYLRYCYDWRSVPYIMITRCLFCAEL